MKTLRYALLLSACLGLFATDAVAQVSGIGYRLAPSASYVSWDGDAALEDGFLYGGGVGLSFGEYVELTGLYLFNNTLQTDFSDFSGRDADPRVQSLRQLEPRDVDLQRYGGELKLNVGSGSLIPFLTAGAGLIRFDVDGKDDPSRNIYLTAGGGVQFSLADRYTLKVQAENLAYRYNAANTFLTPGEIRSTGFEQGDFRQTLVNNLSFRAALQLYLGGRRPGELTDVDRAFLDQFSDGLRGVSLQVQPFYSRVNFDDAFRYDDQSFVGADVGVDLGPLVGLRGFYARGIQSDDPTNFMPIQMFGGLAKFRLASGQGIVPFITFGGGYLDVLSSYNEEVLGDINAAPIEDRPFALGGGGVEIPLSPRIRLHGEVRGLAMTTGDEEDVSNPDDVFISPQFNAGLTFGLGGSRAAPIPVVTQAELNRQIEAERAAAASREADLELQIAQARVEGDSLAVARLRAEQARARVMAADQEVNVAERAAAAPAAREPVVIGREVRTAQGDRIVTVPLPERGELYVRYGDPGGVQIESTFDGEDGAPAAARTTPDALTSKEDLRALVRETLSETLANRDQTAATEADQMAEVERRVEERLLRQLNAEAGNDDLSSTQLQLMERRLADRLSDEIDDLREQLALQQALNQQNNQPVVVPQQQPNVVTITPEGEVISTTPAATTAGGGGFVAAFPVVGIGFGSGAEQVIIGIRADYRTSAFSNVRYYPEFTLGFGGERSFALNVNGVFELPATSGLEPYAGLGLGILGFNDSGDDTSNEFSLNDSSGDDLPSSKLTINLVIGTEYTVGRNRLFTEFQTASFGDFNRIMAGYRFLFN